MTTILEEKQVGNFSVVLWDVGNDIKVEALKSLKAPAGAEHLPAKVIDSNGKILWKFDKHRYPGAYAWLREVDGFGAVIAYATRSELIEVISVKDLPQMRIVCDATGRENYEGGLGILKVVELKELLAADLEVEAKFTPNEAMVARRLREQKQEEDKARRLAEAGARQAARDVQAREQAARVASILARKPIVGFTPDGQRLTGIPVVAKEYEMLPSGKFVIVVASYDSETGTYGDLVEHFSIRKTGGGRVEKINPRVVSKANPAERQSAARMEAKLLFDIGNDPVEVGLYRRADIDALHASGLNGATKVGLAPMNPDGTVTIFEVVKKGVREIGKFRPMA